MVPLKLMEVRNAPQFLGLFLKLQPINLTQINSNCHPISRGGFGLFYTVKNGELLLQSKPIFLWIE